MSDLVINDFSKGFQTFGSPRQLAGFQIFENLDNLKPGRLEKPLAEANKSGTVVNDYSSGVPQGYGFISYRTEYDNDTPPVQLSTVWYLLFVPIGAANWKLYRYNETSNAWDATDVLEQKAATGDWTSVAAIAQISFYVYRGILRISDGLFTNSNVSKWYGHIKRTYWGNADVDYSQAAPAIYQPVPNESHNAWVLENQELTKPTIVKMTGAHDPSGIVNVADEVGIYVYEPRTLYSNLEADDHNLWPDATSKNVFHEDDSYAVTFVYDYINESELSKDADGNLGVSGFSVINQSADEEVQSYQAGGAVTNLTAEPVDATELDIDIDDGTVIKQYSYIRIDQEIIFVTAIAGNTISVVRAQAGSARQTHADNSDIYIIPTEQKARAINLVIHTGTSNTDWNRRITAINLYWKPFDEVDWYLIQSYDVNKGYIDSPLAKYEPSSNIGNNWGAWLACPDHSFIEGAIGRITAVDGTGLQWTDTDYFAITAADNIVVTNPLAGAADTAPVIFSSIKSVLGRIDSLVNDDTIIMLAREYTDRAGRTGSLDPPQVDDYFGTFLAETGKVTSWYVPFRGIKIATYQSLLGRSSVEKVLNVRWLTADVSDDGMAVCFNVDTVDENDQTVRERSRAYWTPPGRSDEFSILRSRDIGKDDGDSGVAVAFWNDAWYLMKDKNIYVYSKDMSIRLKYYPGIGCKFRHSFYKTPFGVVVCDDNQITLLGNEPIELTLMWRKDYQALTLSNPVLGYSSKTNELYFINDTSEDDLVLYKFNFDNQSWRKQTLEDNAVMSNLVLGDALEPLAGFQITGDTARIKEFNTGSASTETAKFKKRFDFGDPNLKKRISGVFATYKTDAMTVDTTADTDEEVDATETEIDVDDGTKFSVNLFIKIDNEIMLVTAIVTDKLTVIRAVAGTVAATHATNEDIFKAADDLTVNLYYDGRTTADEAFTFRAVEGLANMVQKPTTSSNEHKFVDVEISCAGEDLVVEDISLRLEKKGEKLTND